MKYIIRFFIIATFLLSALSARADDETPNAYEQRYGGAPYAAPMNPRQPSPLLRPNLIMRQPFRQ